MIDPRYPIGKPTFKSDLTPEEQKACIDTIAAAPENLRKAVAGLNDQQLDTPYRDGGWTVRQVVHHVPDSHMNAYIRIRLVMTEENPTIRPYDQDKWAGLADSKRMPVQASLALLEALHERWVTLMRGLKHEDFSRTFVHPENGPRDLNWLLQLYAWHGRHHVAHITELRKKMNW